MNNAKMREDSYWREFYSPDYDLLKQEQMLLESQTVWEAEVQALSVISLATPMDVMLRINTAHNTIPYDILMDTCTNAGIMLVYDNKEACLRNCAIPSLLSTAGISGNGVSRVSKEKLAEGLTAFLSGSRDVSQVMSRAGKVAAVLSSQYEYMPGSKLLHICEELQSTFGTMQFRSGAISHDLLTAEFAFPDVAAQITAAYNSALIAAGKPSTTTLTPIVQLRASDTSNEAAKLTTFLKMPGENLLPIGGIKINHLPPLEFDANGNRLTCMDKFRTESSTLFSKMEYEITEIIPKMIATNIEYPKNCFINLCKYAGIPQKWGGQLEEDITLQWPNHSDCTFLDIYEALTRTTALAISEGFPPHSKRILDLEEGIAKIAKNKASWKKYDLPGTVAWHTVKLSLPVAV